MAILPPNTILIYSDGACSGNPGPGGYGAIVLTPEQEVTELGAGDPSTTNNRMEMTGVIKALDAIKTDLRPVWLFTDSTYIIHGITKWSHGWKKRGWQSANGDEIANPDLWQTLYRLTYSRGSEGKIEWRYVRGHTGHAGNERCDEIAVAFSQGQRPKLYRGPMLQYSLEIDDIPEFEPVPEFKPNNGPKKAAHSYLSYVNGVLLRHSTWNECEAATKGRPGAKFKKAMSAEDELAIIQGWGLNPAQLKKGN